jgi:hypothetical protein
MSIKKSLPLALIFLSACLTATAAFAATVDCTLDYPDGTHAGTNDGAIFYPGGKPMRGIDGEMQYPNGAKLLDVDGTIHYLSGAILKKVDGSTDYENGDAMRTLDGQTYLADGTGVAIVRNAFVIDENTQLVMRAWDKGSSYKLRVKTQDTELVVNIDDQANIRCQFVKPIGH